jgi:hypothetical protein
MIELSFDKAQVNPERLHEELAAVVGSDLVGVSAGGGRVRLHLAADPSDAIRTALAVLVAEHDAGQLTAIQQARLDRETRRAALRKAWSAWTAADKDDLLRLLAEEWNLVEEE